MYLCKAYGLNIVSEMPLLNDKIIDQSSVDHDVVVSFGKVDDCDDYFKNHEQDAQLFGIIPNFVRSFISNGKLIVVEPFPGISPESLRNCILGSAMAVLLQQRGFLVLHASCVVIDGMAVAFLGHSGAGKSTICSAFQARGYKFLTDDVMALKIDSQEIMVIPSIPEIKLRDDSASVTNLSGGSLSPLHPLTQKKIHRVRESFDRRVAPLKQIYVLEQGERNYIQLLEVQAAFVELIRHTRSVATLRTQNLDRVHFDRCATLSNNVPISKLVRKFALSELDSVVSLVKDSLMKAEK